MYNNTIYYVSGNQAKFEEASQYLHQHLPDVNVVQKACDVTEIQSLDHREVAVDKACRAWQQIQAPLLIDDAGIYFHRYNQFPGVLTKFVYKGIGLSGIKRLVAVGDKATFILYLVYCTGPTSENCHVFQGVCSGTICEDTTSELSSDFPYDVLFSPDGIEGSYAQMRKTGHHREAVSYRIDALRKFVHWCIES